MYKRVVLVYLSNHGAGLRDLQRFKIIYKNSDIISINNKNILLRILKILSLLTIKPKIYIHIHSDFLGILFKILFIGSHFQVCHNHYDFRSRELSFLNFIDKVIYFCNSKFCKKKIFISKNVYEKFLKNGKLLNFHKGMTKVNFTRNKNLFFFGRDLPYKNIQFIIRIASISPDLNFKIYSNNLDILNYKRISNVEYITKNLSESEVDQIYENNGILILPYLEATQSGPYYLSIEKGVTVISSNINFFQEEKINNDNLYLVDNFDPFVWKKKIENIINEKN